MVKKKVAKKKAVKKKAVKKKPVKKKAVKKKTVNPVIGKMEQEVLKKKQKFKVDYFGEEPVEEPVEEKVLSDESSMSLQITSPEISTGGEYENENEVENYLMKKFAVDVSVTTNNFDHINDDSVDRMTNVYIDFSPIPKDKSFEEMEEGEEVYFDTAPKWLEEVDNIISKENPDYESLIIYVQECYRGEK